MQYSSLSEKDFQELDFISRKLRARIIEMIHHAQCAHLGSSLSCVDLLSVIYWKALRIDPKKPLDPGRDRFILSKGHAATALYSSLAYRGFFDPAILDTFKENGSRLAEHPGPQCVPGVEAATGSLGHGLPIGCGIALASKLAVQDGGKDYRVYVVMSDGECNEGSNWEAALFAAAKKLDNIIAIIDYNKWQATGRSDEVLGIAPLREKWEKFGWQAWEIDGHDLKAVYSAIAEAQSAEGNGKPKMIIANTVKGKGVSFMEDDNNWHYRAPTFDEMKKAWQELGIKEGDLR